MSGLVLHGAPIAVDYWIARNCTNVQLYFLSHMHSDHIKGLSSRWPHTIYCSPVTKKLLVLKFKALEERIHALEMDQPHLLYVGNQDETVTVTLIDARHCFGSCMFLFEGSFGRIFYTADFRFCPAMLYDESFISSVKIAPVNVLYLDNTFCSPNCRPVGSREDCLAEILNLIRAHENHIIVLSLRNFGKENLLIALAHILQRRICVSPSRLEILTAIEAPDVFTCDAEATDIIAVDNGQATPLHKETLNSGRPVLEIVPTALYSALQDSRVLEGSSNRRVVAYSDHSTYKELHEFVKIVAPQRVYPIVTEKGSGRLAKDIPEFVDMQCFQKFLTVERPSDNDVDVDVSSVRPEKYGSLASSPGKSCRYSSSPFKISQSRLSPAKSLTFSSPKRSATGASPKKSANISSPASKALKMNRSKNSLKPVRKLSVAKSKIHRTRTTNRAKGVKYDCDSE